MGADKATQAGALILLERDTNLTTGSSLLVVAAAVVMAVASVGLMLTSPWADDLDQSGWWVDLASSLFTIGVGLVAWRARPGNRVGPLLILLGMAEFIPWLTHSGHPLLWTVGDTWLLASIIVTANLYLAFPEGRTHGWSRRLVIAIYVWWIALTTGHALMREFPSTWPWQNPFLVWPNDEAAATVAIVADLGGLVLGVLVVATVIEKWRQGSSVARRALAPVLWVSPMTLAVVGTWFVGRIVDAETLVSISTGPVAQLTGVLLPVAFLVGLLRTRLDQASIADLVRGLHDVGPGDLEPALAGAVRDSSLQLAFSRPEGPGYVDSAGHAVELPIESPTRALTRIGHADQPIAIILHDPAVDADLIASAAAASRLALDNARLAAELRAQLEAVNASRLRIVEAADNERRRIERDLHDGAQQRLVALSFALRDAARRAGEDAVLTGVLEAAQRELEGGLRDLRAIARGLHPSALDDGLGPAIQELADRSPIPVAVDFDVAHLPESVETTAYFIAAEAVTNALRHAQPGTIAISGIVQDGRLRLEIRDDGRGGAGKAMEGTGMHGLMDRAQALGGSLRVDSRVGVGTAVIAELPIA